MGIKRNIPWAVVVGNGVNALGVLRSLGRASIRSIIVSDHKSALPQRSRYGIGRIVEHIEGESLFVCLEALAASQSAKPILFLTEEKSVVSVSQNRERVQAVSRIVLPEHERLMALMHKQSFQALAEQAGALIPKVVHLKSEANLPELSYLQFPCVLKPAYKHYGYGARFKKAYLLGSVDEVARLYAKIAPVLADMVVQEWIEGGDDDIYFCFQYIDEDGRLIVSFPGRKIRSWPPQVGGTASCLPAWEHAEELEKLTYTFFSSVGFVGIGSMEFKRDQHNGLFYMIEPTVARTDFQEEVATVNGINLPLAVYRHEIGLPPLEILTHSSTHPSILIWRDSVIDRWSQATQGGNAELDRYQACDALWRWDDPGPWLQSIKQRLEWRWRALTRRASPSPKDQSQ